MTDRQGDHIGSAIERGSLILVYDDHGHAVPESQGIRRQGRAAGIHGFHRHRALRLDHLPYGERGETVFAKADHPVQHPVRVDRVDSASWSQVSLSQCDGGNHD